MDPKDELNPELFKDLGINPEQLSENEQKLYKSMQADYTRKTQALAEERKAFATKEQEYMQRLQNYGAMDQELTQWREWYKGLEDSTKNEDEQARLAEEKLLREKLSKGEPDANAKMIEKLEAEINGLKGELLSTKTAFGDSSKRVDRMFNYQAQLTELGTKYPKLDKHALLDFALKNNQTNLEDAYKDLYREELIKEEVERRVQEEVAKIRTDGIHSSSRPVIVRRSENPLTWDGAVESIVKERASKGMLE